MPTSPVSTPRVSVVVPIYNVERYLLECLESLAHQTLRDLEVVMVDDGSTDSSASIAASFAAADHRFRLVQQPNGGLGNARNTGADHASGEYLAFVDSDDVVTQRAYELLATSLDETGSDFATGNFHRLTTTGTRQAGMVFTAFNADRPRTHVSKHPALLNDRTAWNKLFRRTFWDQHAFRWPEGVLYEDIPVTLRAHVLAGKVDVVREPVYLWRARSGDSASITQRRVEPRAVGDRFAAVDGVSRFMAERGEADLKVLYDRSVAAQDLRYFLQHLDEGDATYHSVFLDLANDFFDRARPDVFDELPALQRLEWYLVRHRLLPELLDVVRFENEREAALTPFVRRGRTIYGDYPFRDDPALDIPSETYRLRPDEVPMPAMVEDVWWDGDELHLTGYAYIANVPLASERAGRLRLTLEETGRRDSVVPLTLRRVLRPDLTAAAPDGATNHDWGGWEASVEAKALMHRGEFRPGSWRLRVEVRAGGLTRRRWVSATDAGRASRPQALTVAGARLTPTTPAGHFAVQVSTQHVLVDQVRPDGDVLEVGGVLVGAGLDPQHASLRLSRDDGRASMEVPVSTDAPGDGADTRVLARLDLSRLHGAADAGPSEDVSDGAVWDFTLVPDGSGARLPLLASPGRPEPLRARGDREVVLRVSRTGRVQVVERSVRPHVQQVSWSAEAGIVLSGRYDEESGPSELVLRAEERDVELAVPMERRDGDFSVRLRPDAVPTAGGDVALAAGRWFVFARPVTGAARQVRVSLDPSALEQLPLRADGPRPVTVLDVDERSLAVDVAGDLPPGDQTRAGRQRLRREVFAGGLHRPLLDQVLVDGYANGRHGEDVAALVEELRARGTGLEIVWTTQDGMTPVPDGCRPVPRHGREWYEALARSRYVVATDLQDLDDLATRPDQRILQVWHGIPADRAGLDDEHAVSRRGRHGADRIRREAARWDLVLSAGPRHTELLTGAFALDGGVAETGLPRHDLLVSPARAADRDERATSTRARLGIEAGRRVVLWAPSRRPRQEVAPDRYRLDLAADPVQLAAALGDDHVLLVRPHPKVVDALPDALGPQLVDATWIPDARDLLLVADVLVTDRSSLLFDFALTGRPMVFLLPPDEAAPDSPATVDLPGRVVTDPRGLAEAIDADEPAEAGAARAVLLDAWVPHRDGGAAARAVDQLLLTTRSLEDT
jgi:CDP-glycerol glycerophosphotransferase